jgi:hypothetical protein
VWGSGARRAIGPGALAKSRRRGVAPEAVTIANDAARGVKVWVEVRGVRGRWLWGDYSLTLARR